MEANGAICATGYGLEPESGSNSGFGFDLGAVAIQSGLGTIRPVVPAD